MIVSKNYTKRLVLVKEYFERACMIFDSAFLWKRFCSNPGWAWKGRNCDV